MVRVCYEWAILRVNQNGKFYRTPTVPGLPENATRFGHKLAKT